jgi:hypothetical protein
MSGYFGRAKIACCDTINQTGSGRAAFQALELMSVVAPTSF